MSSVSFQVQKGYTTGQRSQTEAWGGWKVTWPSCQHTSRELRRGWSHSPRPRETFISAWPGSFPRTAQHPWCRGQAREVWPDSRSKYSTSDEADRHASHTHLSNTKARMASTGGPHLNRMGEPIPRAMKTPPRPSLFKTQAIVHPLSPKRENLPTLLRELLLSESEGMMDRTL